MKIKNETFLVNLEQNLKDWKWWYKLFFGLLTLAGLCMSLSNTLIDGTKKLGMEYDEAIERWLSFFTIQSNILVCIWFLYATIFPKKEGYGKILGLNGTILITTYITVTWLIWTTMLLPTQLDNTALGWSGSLILHEFGPISLVVYTIFFSHLDESYSVKEWLKKSWITILYPLAFGIYSLIRGEVKIASGKFDKRAYPYYFVNVHKESYGVPGVAWFFIAAIAIIAISIGLSTLYVFAIDKRLSWTSKREKYQTIER